MKNEKPEDPNSMNESALSLEEVWIDKQEIMMRMHISSRTLQTWRSKGIIPYARIGNKIYYRESDLRNLLRTRIKKASPVLSRSQYGNST